MIILVRRRLALILPLFPLFMLGWAVQALHDGGHHTGPLVVVDPGHGGIDGGCQDGAGHLEKNLNLEMARELRTQLGYRGVAARLTREADRERRTSYVEDLLNRRAMARNAGAAVLVSLHANWHPDPAARGALVVIPPGSESSAALAEAILARLAKVCPLEESRPVVKHGHALLGREGFPIVLVEAGFLSNREEAARLQTAEYRKGLAGAIADGIRDYLRGTMRNEEKAKGQNGTLETQRDVPGTDQGAAVQQR